jgi:hypothetical protein
MTGINGDFYLDTASYNVYKKTAGVWNVICNIKGATGIQGIQGPAGTGADYLRLAPKYTVTLEGGFYHVYKDDGSLSYSTGSFETAVNDEAFAGLGGVVPEAVLTKGSITVDGTILVPTFANLQISGKWTAANALNANMIENLNPATHNYGVCIESVGFPAIIDGNMANQGAGGGKGLYWIQGTEIPNLFTDSTIGYPSALVLRNIIFKNCYDTGIHVDSSASQLSQYGFENVSSWGTTKANSVCCYLKQINDSYLEGGLFDGNTSTYGLSLESVTACSIVPKYLNGPQLLVGCRENEYSVKVIHDTATDPAGNPPAWDIQGERYSRFHDINIRVVGNGVANTRDGMKLSNAWSTYDCTHNRFSNLYFGGVGGGGTRTWKYGIEETDSNQNNNQYVNICGDECATATLRLLGAVSKVQHQNIIGTVAEA